MTAEQARREFDADLLWLPFDLHPEYPPEGIPRAELHARYGEAMHDRLRVMCKCAHILTFRLAARTEAD